MAKWKRSSPNKTSKYKLQFAITAENKLRNIANDKKLKLKHKLKVERRLTKIKK